MGATATVRGTGFGAQGPSGPLAHQRPSAAGRFAAQAERSTPSYRSPLGPFSSPLRRGFTLVEMLVVIAIIGILASLITGAAIMARGRTKRAMARAEIAQLELALTHYKQDVGEFPPDFANLLNSSGTAVTEARNAVLRHLRKRFPRYTPIGNREDPSKTNTEWLKLRHDILHGSNPLPDSQPANDNGYPTADISTFDATAALVFWLGGLPEDASGKPAGFHSDAQFPFKRGLPRTEPLFNFDVARIRNINNVPGYYANSDMSTRPYVYFRAQRLMNAAGKYEYGYIDTNVFYPLSYPAYGSASGVTDYAVPYLDEQSLTSGGSTINFNAPTTTRVWRNQDTFQILFAGSDEAFGTTDAFGNIDVTFRFSKLGQELPRTVGSNEPKPLSGGNYDNITNFTTDTLEAEMLK